MYSQREKSIAADYAYKEPPQVDSSSGYLTATTRALERIHEEFCKQNAEAREILLSIKSDFEANIAEPSYKDCPTNDVVGRMNMLISGIKDEIDKYYCNIRHLSSIR